MLRCNVRAFVFGHEDTACPRLGCGGVWVVVVSRRKFGEEGIEGDLIVRVEEDAFIFEEASLLSELIALGLTKEALELTIAPDDPVSVDDADSRWGKGIASHRTADGSGTPADSLGDGSVACDPTLGDLTHRRVYLLLKLAHLPLPRHDRQSTTTFRRLEPLKVLGLVKLWMMFLRFFPLPGRRLGRLSRLF